MLEHFFKDMKAYGIQRVTPTPVTMESWSGTMYQAFGPNPPGCPSGGKTLYFHKWLPFGLVSGSFFPDGQGNNQAYYCSPENPSFWGWSKFFSLIDQVLAKAQTAGIVVNEIDLQNEVSLFDFTVKARLIYDNITSTPVAQTISQYMVNRGFSSGRVTVSVQMRRPDNMSQLPCPSVYGDSGMLMDTTEVLAAFGGAKIGGPPYITWRGNIPCDSSTSFCTDPYGSPGRAICATANMISLPAIQSTPTITDIHAAVTFNNQGLSQTDVTPLAKAFYSDVYTYLWVRGLLSTQVMFGETNHNQPGNCDNQRGTSAPENVTGYKQSTLFSSLAANVTMRPWENAASSCYISPAQIGTPAGPYGP